MSSRLPSAGGGSLRRLRLLPTFARNITGKGANRLAQDPRTTMPI